MYIFVNEAVFQNVDAIMDQLKEELQSLCFQSSWQELTDLMKDKELPSQMSASVRTKMSVVQKS